MLLRYMSRNNYNRGYQLYAGNMNNNQVNQAIKAIKSRQIGVMPTDTIYGIVALASEQQLVERIYIAKQRPVQKPFIILISKLTHLDEFGITLSKEQKKSLDSLWPGEVSVIMPTTKEQLAYLHRGTSSLAIRLPKPSWLKDIIDSTGPIIATSANVADKVSIQDMEHIKKELPEMDFYINGEVSNQPSRLAKLGENGQLSWLSRT
jgi:L-threonylcarbamoyladenylate synthase